MATEQKDRRPRIFISYSRVDSEFAYRLRADLEASGFDTWIDTAKLADQAGQKWLRLIQDAIDSCQAMVLILSPEAAQSENVHMEYHRIQIQKKLLIPLHYRTVTEVPMDLDLTQWLEFRESSGGSDTTYQNDLTNLLRSLSKAPTPPSYPELPQAPAATALTIAEGADIPTFRQVSPPPPTPPQELMVLMTAAYDARGKGNLADEQYYIQQIVAQDPTFLNGSFQQRLGVVTREIEAQRVQRLRGIAYEAMQAKQWRRALGAWQALSDVLPNDFESQAGARQARLARAEEALRDGEYDEAVGTWQALLKATPTDATAQAGLRQSLRARANNAWSQAEWTRASESWETLRALTPPDPDALDFLDAITQNQRGDPLYQSARRSLEAGNSEGARIALIELYRNIAPYYGDPQGLTAKVNLPTPPNLIEEKDGRAQQKRLEEQQLAAQAERTRQAEAQRQAMIAERQRLATDKAARSRSRWGWRYVFIVSFTVQIVTAVVSVSAAGVSAQELMSGYTAVAVGYEVSLIVGWVVMWLLFYGVVRLAFFIIGSLSSARVTKPLSPQPISTFPSTARALGVIFTYMLLPFAIAELGFGASSSFSITNYTTYVIRYLADPVVVFWATSIGAVIGICAGIACAESWIRKRKPRDLLPG